MKLAGVDIFSDFQVDVVYDVIKHFMDVGEYNPSLYATAVKHQITCSKRACSSCLMGVLVGKISEELRIRKCSDINCYAMTGVILCYFMRDVSKLQTACKRCKDCGNYTKAGCKEHIDWYPEEDDYCSKYKEKENV